MQLVINVVNHIKMRPLKNRLFRKHCQDRVKRHVRLLMHTDVRWLSRGKCLNRFVDLYDEVSTFPETNKKFPALQNFSVQARIFYLADIFEHLDRLN